MVFVASRRTWVLFFSPMLISRTLNPDDDHSLVNQPSAAKSDLNFRPKLPAQNPNQPSLGSTSTVNGGAAKKKPARKRQAHFFGQP